MTPSDIAALSSVLGPVAATVVIVAYFFANAKKSGPSSQDPIMTKLEDISTRLTRVETILEERKK